jgi:hypothetical protein
MWRARQDGFRNFLRSEECRDVGRPAAFLAAPGAPELHLVHELGRYPLTPDNQGGILEVAEPGIAEIYFYGDADGAEFDNLTFTTPTGPMATEETTWGRLKALYR